MTDELEALKRSLTGLLPGRISKAVERYDEFAFQLPNETAKEFAAHHAACKAALSHIDLLVKLLRWAAGEAKETEAADLTEADLLARARAALEKEGGCGDEEEDAP